MIRHPIESFTLLMLGPLAACAQATARSPNRTWITGVTIVSPERLDRIDTGSVLIENGRIARVDRRNAKQPAGATIVSAKGLFLIPGLIDSHVHLTLIPGMNADQAAAHSEIVDAYFRQLPRSYLYYGYTTVVDPGVAVDHQRFAEIEHAPDRPDIYTCGDALAIANGYPMSFYPPARRFELFPNFLFNPKGASAIPPEYKPEDHTPAAAVAAVKRSGGICVKTFFERGFGPNPNLPVLGRDQLAEIRDAATRARLVLMLHANTFEAQRFGVDGGVDVLAHGMWDWGAFNAQAKRPAEIEHLLDEIIRRAIGYQPTMQVQFAQLAYFDSAYLGMPAVAKVVPQAMLDWFRTPDGSSFRSEVDPNNGSDAAMFSVFERGPIRRERLIVSYLAARGANFLFGTDTPAMPSYGNLPGLNGYLEMQQLRKAGMSFAQILQAATINNARAFKLDSEIGTIEVGKVANLLLLTKSPLESADAYDSIVTVWVHGRAMSRDTLAAKQRADRLE